MSGCRHWAGLLYLSLVLPCTLIRADDILVLHTFNNSFPWTVEFETGLRLKSLQSAGSLNLYIESLDVTRFGTAGARDVFSRYMAEKYRDIELDALIGDGDQACRFLEDYCKFPVDIPRVYYTTNFSTTNPAILNLAVNYELVIDHTWYLVRSIFPRMNAAVIIVGDPLVSDNVHRLLKPLAAAAGIPISLVTGFTFRELKEIVTALPPTTAVFYTPVIMDREGNQTIPRQLLSELAADSQAPIFTFWETMIGNGSVGGHMISARTTAGEMLRAVDDFRRTGSFGQEYVISRCMLDWAAMERYGLDTGAIPADAELVNKPPPFYVRYAELVMHIANLALVGFSVILLVAVISIIRAYRRLRGVNRQLQIARKEAETLSLRDTLTGLGNRRAFQPMVDHELQRKSRFGSTASLIIADIDHFKKVNDTYGHDTGDVVLIRVAASLQETIRSTDTLARWGGEEFIILLPDTDERRALALAEKLRTSVMELRFEECPPITISLGVAENAADEAFDEWFKKADQALYQAKQSGRNKTVGISGSLPDAGAEGGRHELLLLQINWREEYRLGVPVYDAQHRDLFALANSLINSIVNNEGKETIVAVLRRLLQSTTGHFEDEERYLQRKRCSLMETHRKEHESLLRNLTQNIESYEQGKLSAYGFISFICNELIVKHILGVDKESFEDIAQG